MWVKFDRSLKFSENNFPNKATAKLIIGTNILKSRNISLEYLQINGNYLNWNTSFKKAIYSPVCGLLVKSRTFNYSRFKFKGLMKSSKGPRVPDRELPPTTSKNSHLYQNSLPIAKKVSFLFKILIT